MNPAVITRVRVSALLLAGAALGATISTGRAQTVAPIRLAVYSNENSAEAYYAKDMGFFARAGIDVEFQTMQGNAATVAAIISNASDVAWYKITWLSDEPAFYTPYLPDRTAMAESPNMIVRAAAGIAVLERWAMDYQKNYSRRSATGLIVPKAQVGAIRSGNPTSPKTSPQICSLYLGAFIVPGQNPISIRDEIRRALADGGVPASEIELYLFKPGYEAKGAGLIDAVREAHLATIGSPPPPRNSATCSMWRDVNSFNEVGVPAITYGPRSERHEYRKSFTIDSLYNAACVYARTIVDICNQEKPAS